MKKNLYVEKKVVSLQPQNKKKELFDKADKSRCNSVGRVADL